MGKGQETKTRRQVGYLLSDNSPLTAKQQEKLRRELHSGQVKVAPDKQHK